MGQNIFLIFVLTVLTVLDSGFHCIPSGGHHGHDGGHQHGTHDNENPGEGNQIDLSGIFNELGIKVLGKDQESADEKSPVQDHSQINFKAVISEILHPSTFSPPVSTTTKPISSTQKLPIKSHREGWFESPVALVLNNQVLEPVYDQEISSSTPRTVYLTETPYFKSSQSTTQFKPLTDTFQRRSADIDLMTGNLENLLTNKKLMPVVNTRWANYRVANRRGRSHKVGIGSTRVRNKENQVLKDGRRFGETLSSSPRVSNLQKSSRRSKSSKVS
ncbi:uncharacterized protein LOC111696978 [Eurytemora carolleeae]|uniref:uncharacterized protein LOC111696978 n=1 Tax=Eurytemora carolleeae TaxID=1294199 RepID=UPI000C78A624|nr:uncharacterized protein LOC111696978 [Eurytemora carolleeae]|eukprot:XP_023322594.1 uncharacterized protein LOC111696978 [Eurytemora affinis]